MHNYEVGAKYEWHPETMRGLDRKEYKVYTTHASGRGWSARQYHSPIVPITKTFIVQVMPSRQWDDEDGTIHIKLVRGVGARMYNFARRPYVRKDGSFTVVNPDYATYGNAYGFIRIDDAYWTASYELRDTQSFVQLYYSDLAAAGYLKKGQKDSLGHIHVKKNQLIKV